MNKIPTRLRTQHCVGMQIRQTLDNTFKCDVAAVLFEQVKDKIDNDFQKLEDFFK